MERVPENRLAEPAIRTAGLSKCYRLYERPLHRLLQLLKGDGRRYYREFWALRDASFEVARGEVLGIVGRNGAGKSTLLQLVCGTLTPTAGSIDVNGRVAALLELGAGFNPEFTGRENVLLAASILGLTKAEIDQRLEGIIDFSGIRDFIDQPVKFYSSGMYVRLAFSVATSVDPDILVIDEALSVGDGEFARKSFDRILELKKTGVTILFCSHALYQMEAFCDRVLWLEHGRAVLLGTPRDVVRKYTEFLVAGNLPASPEFPATSERASSKNSREVSGYARFTRIETALDGKVGRELRARPGQNTLTVSVQFESDPALPPPVIGVTVDYGTLLAVTCAVSRSDGVTIERDSAGRGEVTLGFPRLELRKGEYRIGAYLGCENALHVYEGVQQCATLIVDDAFPEPGLVNLPHEWRSVPGHSNGSGAAAPGSNDAPPAEGSLGNRRRATLRDGRMLWVDPADSLGLARTGIFEPDESSLCASVLRPGDRVLDVGANVGYYATLFAERIGSAGRVDAIEPDAENFALLDLNTRELQQSGRVRLHALALAATTGSVRLYRSKDNTGMHRVYDSVCCDGTAVEVPAKRGDELALAPLDFIKIDVEGFEAAALEGLSSTLAQSPRVKILCEYSPVAMLEAGSNPGRWLRWMKAQGFHPLAFDGEAWTAAACADLESQTALLDSLDMAALTAPLKDAGNIAIASAAEAAARTRGYTRPLVENLLFVRDPHVSIAPPRGNSSTRSSGNANGAASQGDGGSNVAWSVQPALDKEEHALLDLFARAFGHAMPPAQWRWKYAHAHSAGMVVRRGDRIVGFYGGMPRDIRLHGEPMSAVQIGDVMVDPAERGVLTRRGPFFLATSQFAESLIGPGRPYAFAFGFPSERHARLGERLGLYARVDEILEATWPPLRPTPSVFKRTRPLRDHEITCIDALWARMAEDLRDTALAVRDGAYIRHRFLEHPTVRYSVLLVRHRFTGRPEGLVVLRDHEDSGIELIDVVAPAQSLALLVTVARRVAGRLGRHRVFAWMTPRAAESFKASNPVLAPAGIPVPTIIWKAVPDLEKLRGHWWLLGGDADSR